MVYRITNSALVLSSLILLGYVSFQAWTALFMKPVSDREGEPPLIFANRPQAQTDVYQLQQILDAQLFGAPERVKPAIVQTLVPKTRLSLKLHGMVGSSDPLLARALISVGNKIPRSFGIGEKIPNTDASIHGVEKSRVLLDRKGNVERLGLDK